MAQLVDAYAQGAYVERHASSNLAECTMKHNLVQDKMASGSQKSEYHCEKCQCKWAYYDQGSFERSKEYIDKYFPCKKLT